MARFGAIFISIFLLILVIGQAGPAQSGKDKAGAAKKDTPQSAKEQTTKPADDAALPQEIKHRIEIELRSRYSVPPQINISVSDPKPGNTPGYDDVVVTFTGGTHTTTHDFLVSKDRKTLAHFEKIDISQDLMSKIDVKGRPVKGNPDAKVTIVNFDDFECPFCSRMHQTLFSNVFKDYEGKVRVIYKDYPLVEIHPWAMHAAIDGNCLGEQNSPAYWDFADYVHANQKMISGKSIADANANLDSQTKDQAQKHQLDQVKLQACMQKQDESGVRASMAEGDKLGVDSTPTLFINGERFTGAVPEQELRAVLDRALADAAQAPTNAKK
ncbi:MAG: thioredoxin domain-containing protein [Candidatus Angelobacter sp.]